MFERFTEPARHAVVLAQDDARLFGHDYLGTEHLLLGLLAEQRGMAARVLATRGVTVQAARDSVVARAGRKEPAPTGQIAFTPALNRALELSLDEARALGHGLIGTEHLLLGLARGADGAVAHVLADLGTTPEQVHRDVIAAFSGPAPD